jgi:CheY-like chemotaxis protein
MNLQQQQQQISEYDKNKDFKIIVVEDNVTNQKVIIEMLHKLGYSNVDVTMSGFEAIDMIKTKKYQLALLDLKMPGMSGITLAKKIREWEEQQQQQPKMTLVAVTAAALRSEKDYYMKEGVLDNYIVKPIKINILQDTVTKVQNHCQRQSNPIDFDSTESETI